MKNRIGFILGAVFACTVSALAGNAKDLKLTSPNGVHTVLFQQKQISPEVNEVHYQVTYKGIPVVEKSRAGLGVDNRIWEMALGVRNLKQPACWMDNLEVDSVTTLPGVDNTWQPFYGERSTVRDNYNAATMHLSKRMVQAIGLTSRCVPTMKASLSAIFSPNIPKPFSIKWWLT